MDKYIIKYSYLNVRISIKRVKNNDYLIKALSVDPVYLRYDNMEKTIDYRVLQHFFIFLSNRNVHTFIFKFRIGESH